MLYLLSLSLPPGMEDWLPVLGYDMTSLIPEVNRYGNPLPSASLGRYRDLKQSATRDYVNWAKVGDWIEILFFVLVSHSVDEVTGSN